MTEKGIPRSPDWQDTGDTPEATHSEWGPRIPDDGIEGPETIGVRLRNTTTFGDVVVPDESGRPRGIRQQIIQDVSPIRQHWRRKQQAEPCCQCVHWIRERFSPEQKANLIGDLVKEHGWTDELVTLDLGDVANYEFCEADALLSHKFATCARKFRRRD